MENREFGETCFFEKARKDMKDMISFISRKMVLISSKHRLALNGA